MCYLDGIASFLWGEGEVDAERSSLNVNVSSLSLSVEEGQVIPASQEYPLQAGEEAREESVELSLFSKIQPLIYSVDLRVGVLRLSRLPRLRE